MIGVRNVRLLVTRYPADGRLVIHEIPVGGWKYLRYDGPDDVCQVALLRQLGFNIEEVQCDTS